MLKKSLKCFPDMSVTGSNSVFSAIQWPLACIDLLDLRCLSQFLRVRCFMLMLEAVHSEMSTLLCNRVDVI